MYRGVGRGCFQRFQKTPYKIWTYEFGTGTQHTIQFGYSKQLIVMTQCNNLLEHKLLSSFRCRGNMTLFCLKDQYTPIEQSVYTLIEQLCVLYRTIM